MKQSRLKNLFYKRTHEHWVNYKRQRNHLVNTLVKIKKNYYTNLNMKDITDSKKFWKAIKPNSNNKVSNSSKIILSEKGLFWMTIRKFVTQWTTNS